MTEENVNENWDEITETEVSHTNKAKISKLIK